MRRWVFSDESRGKLATCHPALQAVATRALELSPVDFMIVWGYRTKAQQDLMIVDKKSKAPWPTSKHNNQDENGNPLSLAIDFAPIIEGRVPWGDERLFARMAGVFDAAATERGVEIRWGGDWDRDGSSLDQKFNDLGHIELVI